MVYWQLASAFKGFDATNYIAVKHVSMVNNQREVASFVLNLTLFADNVRAK